ncbi:MAG TPA: ankyrin repeat domain-containing protein [Candidatus Babeliales bacterium]|nr:ankyrin repeat domain-containing protein [Candidatus Babeliales bacterium]
MKLKNNFIKTLMVSFLLSGFVPLVAMQRAKRIVRQLKGKPEYTEDIFDAIEQGRLDSVKYWLDQGVGTESKYQGRTLLMDAVLRGQSEIAKLLLDRGANIEVVAKNGETPLMIAIGMSNITLIKMLLDRDAIVEGDAALEVFDLAITKDSNELVESLLRNLMRKGIKFDFDKQNGRGEALLIQSVINGSGKIVEILIANGANPYLQDKTGLDAFDYAQEDAKLLAVLGKTKFQAPVKRLATENVTDTQKAVRRLKRLSEHLYAEEQQGEISTNLQELPIGAMLTPTEVHYKKFSKEIESQFGENSTYGKKGRALLDDPLVKKCMVKEGEAYQQGKYVFYRSEPGRYRVYEYFLEELYRLVRLFGEKNPIIFTRFFRDAAQERDINEYIDTKPWQAHKLGGEKNVLLSANIPLFGNVDNSGSCTWYYFLKNYEATGKVELQIMFERVFDQYGFDKKFIATLLSLHQGALEKISSLQQIIIPKNIVDKVVMFATHGYCFPWPTMVDPSCWDPNAMSVDGSGNEKRGRHTCIASIIDKYRNGEIEIDDNMQVRILMNAVYGLNPESGIEFNLYTRLPKKRIEYFKKQVAEITDKMFGEWLKKQLQSKEVPADIADEPLGDVLKYLGKGRKQEKMKAKL